MLVVTSERLASYYKCPRKCYYMWKEASPSPDLYIKSIQDIIKKTYTRQQRKGEPPTRRLISYWCNKAIEQRNFEDKIRYKEGISLLSLISSWYSDIYLDKYCEPSLTNFPITLSLDNLVTFSTKIDIISIGDELTLFDFDEARGSQYTGITILRDIQAVSKIWACWKALEIKPDKYVRLVIGKQKIKDVGITITDDLLQRMDRTMKQLLSGFADEAFYPIYSDQCASCSYYYKCIF